MPIGATVQPTAPFALHFRRVRHLVASKTDTDDNAARIYPVGVFQCASYRQCRGQLQYRLVGDIVEALSLPLWRMSRN